MKVKVFYGWWVVVSVLLAMLVHAGAVFYVFGIFYKPFLEEFGWSRAAVAGAITIYMVTLGITAPFIGKLTDKYGAKTVIWVGALFGGIAFILLSRITSLLQLYVLYFILGIGFSACGIVPVNSAISNWFTKKRGTAIGIAMAGVSLGAIIITPTGGYIMTHFGWRATYLFLAILTWLLVIPIVVWVMKNTPQEMGLLPDGNTPLVNHEDAVTSQDSHQSDQEEAWTLKRATKSGSFWLINLAFFLICIGIGAVLQHEIVFFTDKGIPMTAAAVALGLTGFIGGFGKITFGTLADRFSPKYIAMLCFTLQAFGTLLLLFTQSMIMVWVFVFVFGFSMGGQIALQPLVVGQFFGLASFGTIYGIIAMAGAIGSATGPVIAGLAYDSSGSYNWVFLGCVVASLMAVVSIFLSRRQAPQL